MRQIGTVLLSALLMWMSFPPARLGIHHLHRTGTIPVGAATGGDSEGGGLARLSLGFVFFGSMLSWIFVLGGIAWFPLTIMMALYATLYGLAMYLARTWSVWRWWVMAMGMWALWDWPAPAGRSEDSHGVRSDSRSARCRGPGFGAMDRGIWLGWS